MTLNNSLLHVLNHALKRFLFEVLIDLINYGIHFYLIRKSFQEYRGWNLAINTINKSKLRTFLGWEVQTENLNNVD